MQNTLVEFFGVRKPAGLVVVDGLSEQLFSLCLAGRHLMSDRTRHALRKLSGSMPPDLRCF